MNFSWSFFVFFEVGRVQFQADFNHDFDTTSTGALLRFIY